MSESSSKDASTIDTGTSIASDATQDRHSLEQRTDQPEANKLAFAQNAGIRIPEHDIVHARKASAAGLHIQTQIRTPSSVETRASRDVPSISQPSDQVQQEHLSGEWKIPSFANRRSFELERSGSWSASSTSSSPAFSASALGDVTPLPSPISAASPLDLSRKLARRSHSNSLTGEGNLLPPSALSRSPSRKKKTLYGTLASHTTYARSEKHERNRSLSDYTLDPLHNAKQRHVTGPTVLNSVQGRTTPPAEPQLHREAFEPARRESATLANANREAAAAASIPSPPPSNRSQADSDEGEESQKTAKSRGEVFTVPDAAYRKPLRWKLLRLLGQGAFSEVFLASRLPDSDAAPEEEPRPRTAELVAIKIVSHGPSGDADEERMETSIRREIEIMQSLSHPCLVQMRAFEDDESRALIVLNYCPGGDLFELASQRRELLVPDLIQRVFAELVEAVAYLHSQSIVHRDIKLENVLLNFPPLSFPSEPKAYPYSLTTLTDLGLSKRLPPPPASPLLTHPCGSADYAAPELLLGRSYDGRATDAWALGVLLYALVEGRLPFDGTGERGGTKSVKHRIARCDWMWVEYGDEEGDWIGDSTNDGIEEVPGLKKAKARQLEGCRQVVEGLLKKRGRWSVDKVKNLEWVRGQVDVEGGLRRKP